MIDSVMATAVNNADAVNNQQVSEAINEIEAQTDTSSNVLQYIQKKVAKKTFNVGKVLVIDEEKFNWGVIEKRFKRCEKIARLSK